MNAVQLEMLGAQLAERMGCTGLRAAVLAARRRGIDGIGTVAAPGGCCVVITKFIGKKCIVTPLSERLSLADAVEFLDSL